MIEGVIVISTMLVFLGLIVFVRKAYGAKLDLQQQTRANVLYYSSHGCTGSVGPQPTLEEKSTIGGSRQAENAASKSQVAGKEAASRTWNTANAKANMTVSWVAVWDTNATTTKGGAINLQKHRLDRQISAASTVTCNEKKYDSQWQAWMQFGIDLVSRGGGVGDLFQ
jgi:hypothetical protein